MKLGLVDSVADGHFLPLDDGRIAFYPRGPFGRMGYILDSSEFEVHLRRGLQRVYGIWFGAFFGYLGYWALTRNSPIEPGLFTTYLLVCFVLIAASGYHFWLYRTVRHLPRAPTNNSYMAAWRRMGRIVHPAVLWGLAALASAFALYMFFIAITVGSIVPLFFTLLCGLLATPYWVALHARYSANRTGGDSLSR